MKRRRSYSLERKGNMITFWTDDSDIAEKVDEFILMLIDADNYRSQIERVAREKEAADATDK